LNALPNNEAADSDLVRVLAFYDPALSQNSQFTYDPFGRNVEILEYTSSSLTSSKMFVWCGLQRCEQRNSGSSVTGQFFARGETITGTNYYWTKDHLGSIREVTNSGGTIQTEYLYDPYGRPITAQGSLVSDFQYVRSYVHSRSSLNLTYKRAFASALGRWINRDPLAEISGSNLYKYCLNVPIRYTDPLGLAVAIVVSPDEPRIGGHCGVLIGNDDDGWTYLSNAWGGDPRSGMTFDTLKDFFDQMSQFAPANSAYFPNGNDAGATNAAQASLGRGYNVVTNNCAHTCRDALRGAGVAMPEGGLGNSGALLTPAEVLQQAQARGGFPAPTGE
jgi:RHS repeat-associated protein